MKSNYIVKVRPVAAIQLTSHIEFLARKSKKAANKIVNDFEKLEKMLNENPTSFPLFYKNYRKAIIEPFYAVLFEVEGNIVFVSKILDTRQLEYNDIIIDLN